eukprot:2844421-Pyramimonas_sp.AAC.1
MLVDAFMAAAAYLVRLISEALHRHTLPDLGAGGGRDQLRLGVIRIGCRQHHPLRLDPPHRLGHTAHESP